MRIFLTHILPKESVFKYKLSIAANNFCWNLIEGGLFDKVYSILPTNVKGELDDSLMDGLVYCRLRRLGRIFTFMAVFVENIAVFRKIPSKSQVWFYNITILNTFLYILLRCFKRNTKIYVVVLDYTPSSSFLQKFFLWQVNHADGNILLSQSPLFTNPNTICLPGITPAVADNYPIQKSVGKEFLLSGVLNERIAMLEMVLHVFSTLPELTLHLTGEVLQGDLVKKYSGFKNIFFHGQLSYSDYLDILHHVSFQLSTRHPGYPENQCNFPSKIIEALLHNRIVISTIHYEQLGDIRYFEVHHDEDLFKQDLLAICSMKESELLSYANQGRVISDHYNPRAWSNAITTIEAGC